MPQVIYMTLFIESAADQTDHFANAFVRKKNVIFGYEVVTTLCRSKVDAICLE